MDRVFFDVQIKCSSIFESSKNHKFVINSTSYDHNGHSFLCFVNMFTSTEILKALAVLSSLGVDESLIVLTIEFFSVRSSLNAFLSK